MSLLTYLINNNIINMNNIHTDPKPWNGSVNTFWGYYIFVFKIKVQHINASLMEVIVSASITQFESTV